MPGYQRHNAQYTNWIAFNAALSHLHDTEKAYFRLRHGEALLAWADVLYRSDDAAMIQRAYSLITQHFIDTGRAPHYSELADALSIDIDAGRDLVLDVIRESAPVTAAWMAHDADVIESWAPFSNVANHIPISVDGVQKWFGQ